ncbi:MAG: UDP-N-acetylglucosamine 2-epimerase [Moraxellaceae bacterium]|jgi:UDP-hydrolysing UDP-N-acetyl-D-glucosamine 2-epimerase|nr:UDP-N-acetylglucosamine 2-epimerase [Moraxellaceae bacterium]
MKILALTSIRSEYDLMSNLYRLLDQDPDTDFRLLVSGAHLSPTQGMTVNNIRSDGLTILAEVESLLSADSPSSRLKSASTLLAGSIDVVRAFAPDLILFAGDREDVLVGAMLGSFLGIPTLHFFGGDHAVDGHIDNPVRHATSKLASAHFVSLPQHRERLLAMGEAAHRIAVIGSVALDKFVSEPPLSRAAVLAELDAGVHAATHPLAILIFHPLEDEREQAPAYVRNAVEALLEQGFHVCIGLPNTDPGSFGVVAAIERYAGHEGVTFYRNLPRSCFVNLMRVARLIVGNSSAGLLEAPSVPLAAINIGKRQRGRLAAANVIFTEGDAGSIRAAITTALSPAFQQELAGMDNPYGDGRSSLRALDLIKSLDFSALLRKTEDPLASSP